MNINIYDEASLLALSTTERNLNERHTVSSRNKQKLGKNTVISQSDYTVQQCLQSLDQQPSNKRTINNHEMYNLGQQYLSRQQQKLEWLAQKVDEQKMRECSFKPTLCVGSQMACSRVSHIPIQRQSAIPLDSQAKKLEKELEECTFSPRILKTGVDKFDRTSPIYQRQIEWKKQISEKNSQSQLKLQSKLWSTIGVRACPKEMDLRAQHALSKNFSAKYLRRSLFEQQHFSNHQ